MVHSWPLLRVAYTATWNARVEMKAPSFLTGAFDSMRETLKTLTVSCLAKVMRRKLKGVSRRQGWDPWRAKRELLVVNEVVEAQR